MSYPSHESADAKQALMISMMKRKYPHGIPTPPSTPQRTPTPTRQSKRGHNENDAPQQPGMFKGPLPGAFMKDQMFACVEGKVQAVPVERTLRTRKPVEQKQRGPIRKLYTLPQATRYPRTLKTPSTGAGRSGSSSRDSTPSLISDSSEGDSSMDVDSVNELLPCPINSHGNNIVPPTAGSFPSYGFDQYGGMDKYEYEDMVRAVQLQMEQQMNAVPESQINAMFDTYVNSDACASPCPEYY